MFYVGMALAAWLGGFVQTMVGFGAAVCILLYLTNFMSISAAPSVAAVVCLVLNFSLVMQFRKSVRVKKIWAPMAIYSVVSLLVVSLIKSFQANTLTIFFGIFLILIAVYYLFLSKRIKIHDNGTGMMLASSSISGLFAGLFSIGGPTLSIYYIALLGPGDLFIANLQISFLIVNIVLCVGRAANGLLTISMIPACVVGIIGAIFGQIIGRMLRDKLSTNVLAKLVYSAVGISGLLVILQHI